MAAKHILMGFCALYALARGIGTVLYYLSGAGQLQIAVTPMEPSSATKLAVGTPKKSAIK